MSTINVYLAAPYAARDQIRVYAAELAQIDMHCTSSWLDEQLTIGPGTLGASTDIDDGAAHGHCVKDFRDINDAYTLVAFTGEACRAMRLPDLAADTLHSGGRHIETGYALARRKPVIILGPAENIFHRGACTVVPDWHAAVLELVKLVNALPQNTERAS